MPGNAQRRRRVIQALLQSKEEGLQKFVVESHRDGARTLFMSEPISPGLGGTESMALRSRLSMRHRAALPTSCRS